MFVLVKGTVGADLENLAPAAFCCLLFKNVLLSENNVNLNTIKIIV